MKSKSASQKQQKNKKTSSSALSKKKQNAKVLEDLLASLQPEWDNTRPNAALWPSIWRQMKKATFYVPANPVLLEDGFQEEYQYFKMLAHENMNTWELPLVAPVWDPQIGFLLPVFTSLERFRAFSWEEDNPAILEVSLGALLDFVGNSRNISGISLNTGTDSVAFPTYDLLDVFSQSAYRPAMPKEIPNRTVSVEDGAPYVDTAVLEALRKEAARHRSLRRLWLARMNKTFGPSRFLLIYDSIKQPNSYRDIVDVFQKASRSYRFESTYLEDCYETGDPAAQVAETCEPVYVRQPRKAKR